MATLQLRKRSYRVLFCLNGKRYSYTIGKVGKREAMLASANVDRLLLRVEQKLLTHSASRYRQVTRSPLRSAGGA